MSIPLAFAAMCEGTVELEDSIASLTQKLSQIERASQK
jgi:ubiquinone biosynthesis protein UbiJ